MSKIFSFRNIVYTFMAISSATVVAYVIIGFYHLFQHNYFDLFFDLLCVAMNTWCFTVQLNTLKLDKLSQDIKNT